MIPKISSRGEIAISRAPFISSLLKAVFDGHPPTFVPDSIQPTGYKRPESLLATSSLDGRLGPFLATQSLSFPRAALINEPEPVRLETERWVPYFGWCIGIRDWGMMPSQDPNT